MPLLHFRIATWVILCTLVSCALPYAAFAAQTLASLPEEVDEYPLPVRLAPMRTPQTPSASLQKSILESLLQTEEAARLEDGAVASLEAEERARESRALALTEQQEARESARILREQLQARATLIAGMLKMPIPPAVAVVPPKSEWPLPKFVEDPAWETPQSDFFYQNPYSQRDVKSRYRTLIKEAVRGNPRAMMVLADAYGRWGVEISSAFSLMYPPMHNSDYWRRWALQLTSPDWVELRFGDLSPDMEEKLSHYRAAMAYQNSEAAYNVAIMDDRPELLIEAAQAGHPRAASMVAFNLGMGTEEFPNSPRLASLYWWRGALAGDVRSMLVCSEFFYQGQNGFPKDERRSFMFALLAFEEAQKKSGVDAGLLSTAVRHLAGLAEALGISQGDIWERKQELEIFRSAPEEEFLARLGAEAPAREAVLYALEEELAAVRAALGENEESLSAQQILLRFEQSGANGGAEKPRLPVTFADTQRQHDNYYFFKIGVLGMMLILGGYLAMRLHFYSRIVSLVSVKEGGPV